MMNALVALVLAAAAGPAAPDAAQVGRYLDALGANMIGRHLSDGERRVVARDPAGAIPAVLDDWLESETFLRSSEDFIETKLATSGKTAAIDFGRPGRLMQYLVRTGRPYAEILTRCAPDDGSDSYCDSGTGEAAGVLSSRAFLVSSETRYNIGRARNMLREFLCEDYPLPDTLEPRAAKADLLPKFAVDAGANTNGNGSSCYLCHGQFALHTQLFVNIDKDGLAVAQPTGVQDPVGEPGTAAGGAYASHFAAAPRSGSTASAMLGTPVSGLGEAAGVIARHPLFQQCAVREVLRYYLQLDHAQAAAINRRLIERITAAVLARGPAPTFKDYVKGAFADPAVLESFGSQGAEARHEVP